MIVRPTKMDLSYINTEAFVDKLGKPENMRVKLPDVLSPKLLKKVLSRECAYTACDMLHTHTSDLIMCTYPALSTYYCPA